MNYYEYFGVANNLGAGTQATPINPTEDWSGCFQQDVRQVPVEKVYSDSPVVQGGRRQTYAEADPIVTMRPTHDQMIAQQQERFLSNKMAEAQREYNKVWADKIRQMEEESMSDEKKEEVKEKKRIKMSFVADENKAPVKEQPVKKEPEQPVIEDVKNEEVPEVASSVLQEDPLEDSIGILNTEEERLELGGINMLEEVQEESVVENPVEEIPEEPASPEDEIEFPEIEPEEAVVYPELNNEPELEPEVETEPIVPIVTGDTEIEGIDEELESENVDIPDELGGLDMSDFGEPPVVDEDAEYEARHRAIQEQRKAEEETAAKKTSSRKKADTSARKKPVVETTKKKKAAPKKNAIKKK